MLTAALVLAFQLPESGPRPTVRFERDSPLEIVRFNRAEGLSAGWGGTFVIRESMTTLYARARYAFGDERAQGLVGLRKDYLQGRRELAAFSEMRDTDPLAPGLGADNTIPALLLSHDDGSYVMATGMTVAVAGASRRGRQVRLALSYVRESAPRATTGGGLVNDFPPNTPVREESFLLVQGAMSGGEPERYWFAGLEGGATGMSFGRVWAGLEHRYEIGSGVDVAIAGWAGVGAAADSAVPQREFRLGGARSLRGYDAGALRGPSAISMSADVGAAHRIISPVAFVDVGMTSRDDAPAASVGAGLSLLRGIARLHVALPVDRKGDVRLDVLFNARR